MGDQTTVLGVRIQPAAHEHRDEYPGTQGVRGEPHAAPTQTRCEPAPPQLALRPFESHD